MRITPVSGATLQSATSGVFNTVLDAWFAGMKVGISIAPVGAIVGEFVAGSDGLGTVILIAEGQFDTTRVIAALVMLGCSEERFSTSSSSPERCCCLASIPPRTAWQRPGLEQFARSTPGTALE